MGSCRRNAPSPSSGESTGEDLARLGGFLAGTSQARTAAEEPVARRLWHRLPWLALGLLGAMASAAIVASFEDELAQQVLLAVFVPAHGRGATRIRCWSVGDGDPGPALDRHLLRGRRRTRTVAAPLARQCGATRFGSKVARSGSK